MTDARNINELIFGSAKAGRKALRSALRGVNVADASGIVRFTKPGLVTSIVETFNSPIGDLLLGVLELERKIDDACLATANQPSLERRIPFETYERQLTKLFQVVFERESTYVPFLTIRIRVELNLRNALVLVRGGRVAGLCPGEASVAGAVDFSRTGEGRFYEIHRFKRPAMRLPEYVSIAEPRRALVRT